MNTFEQMMSNLPRLRHLELVSHCDNDVIDGHRWHKKVNKLDTFNFMFHISDELQSEQLDSFRTPFWLNEKRWYVGYMIGRFLSVPHFIPRQVNNNFRLLRHTTAPNDEFLYEHTDKLDLAKALRHQSAYFPHVHTLTLSFVPSLPTVTRIVDLRQVRHLTLFSLKEASLIGPLIDELPNLNEISINYDGKSFIEYVSQKNFNQIRILRISNCLTPIDDYNIEDLCLAFPYLERLQTNDKCSTEKIFHFLYRLKYLSTASFRCAAWFAGANKETHLRIRSDLDEMLHLNELNYTYRLDESAAAHFWILSQSNQHRT